MTEAFDDRTLIVVAGNTDPGIGVEAALLCPPNRLLPPASPASKLGGSA